MRVYCVIYVFVLEVKLIVDVVLYNKYIFSMVWGKLYRSWGWGLLGDNLKGWFLEMVNNNKCDNYLL